MLRYLALAAAIAGLSAIATADQSAAVVRLEDHGKDGQTTGSAVLIGNGFALTAEHCAVRDAAFVTQPVKAELVFDPVKNGIDEAKLIRVATNSAASATIGDPPKVGDQVYGIGYPHGVFEKYTGRVTSVSSQFITTDLRVDHGASGGGLFNMNDELIGICSAKDDDGRSYWIHTDSLVAAASRAEFMQSAPSAYDRDTRVVVLSLKGCGPCEVLKRDIADGKFPGFAFEIATYDASIGTWDKPELHAAFVAECKAPKFVAAPTIWVPGTGKYKEGYDTRPGLIGWFEDVVRLIFRGPPPTIPIGQSSVAPAVPLIDTSLISEVAGLREQLAKLKADYTEFRETGLIGKVKSIAVLKEDKAAIEASIAEIRSSAKDIKEGPLPAIISSLIGLVTGIVHFWSSRKQGAV